MCVSLAEFKPQITKHRSYEYKYQLCAASTVHRVEVRRVEMFSKPQPGAANPNLKGEYELQVGNETSTHNFHLIFLKPLLWIFPKFNMLLYLLHMQTIFFV